MSDDTVHAGARTGPPITEADLHAYLDDQLSETRRLEVATFLAQQPEAARRVQDWQRQKDALHAWLDPVLQEPLPLRLPLCAPERDGLRLIAAIAAWLRGGMLVTSLAVAILSAGAAWYVRGVVDAPAPAVLAHANPGGLSDSAMFAHRAAVAHSVYAADIRRPVEIRGDQADTLITWLSKRLGAEVKAPVLSALGYELVGGRLLPGGQGPVAQFMYAAADGQRLTLYVTREAQGNQTAFRFTQDGAIRIFYWIDGNFGYALSGEIDRGPLQQVADEVYQQLS